MGYCGVEVVFRNPRKATIRKPEMVSEVKL
jgi:hypothetical protein